MGWGHGHVSGDSAVKVLVFHNFYRSTRPSGENAAVLQDVALMSEAGHEVLLARKDSDAALSGGLAGAVRAAASAVYAVGSRAEAAELARSTGADVAHVHNMYPLWSPSVLDGLRDAGVPRVQVLHNYRLSCIIASHMLDGAPCYRCMGRRVPTPGAVHRCYGSVAGSLAMTVSRAVNTPRLLGSEWYLAVSDTVRRRAVEHGVPADRISVKPEFVSDQAPSAPDRAGAPYLAFVGRLDVNKGVRVLLEAFELYRARGGPLELRIAGSGPLEAETADAAARIGGVEVLGRVAPERALAVMAGARAVTSPALWEEPFGLTVLEAWREGRPIIVSDLGGPADMVDDTTGWVVPPSVEALAAAFAEADDAEEAERRGSAGRTRLGRHFTGAATLAAYSHAWDRLAL